jgi:uncharacterized membrane protein
MFTIAEIHPMLVHFPIVFWISAEAIAVVVLLRGGDLSARQQWPLTALYCLLAGTACAILAAVFGDMASDQALAAGFAAGPIETHETFAVATIVVFGLHTALRLWAVWRRYSLAGPRGWVAELPGALGIAGLLTTAYLGGELVYRLGVNVTTAVH